MEGLVLGLLAGLQHHLPSLQKEEFIIYILGSSKKVPIALKELKALLPWVACHRTCTTKYLRLPYPTLPVLRAWPRKTKGSSSRTGGIN